MGYHWRIPLQGTQVHCIDLGGQVGASGVQCILDLSVCSHRDVYQVDSSSLATTCKETCNYSE